MESASRRPTVRAGHGPSNIRLGIFDWLDGDSSYAAGVYDQRLRIVEYADTAGFDTYQLAEHHGTPLGLARSPNLFVSAIASRTRRTAARA
jgi:alkanesulfonate monooxygenase SsuD/methylene tetrahydromethanopterin reductase-like flavin-dependent oxidoreductase (luciferase family)